MQTENEIPANDDVPDEQTLRSAIRAALEYAVNYYDDPEAEQLAFAIALNIALACERHPSTMEEYEELSTHIVLLIKYLVAKVEDLSPNVSKFVSNSMLSSWGTED